MVPTPSPSRLPTPGTNTILDPSVVMSVVIFILSRASSPSLMHLGLGAAVCFPALATTCGNGYGMAVCPILGLLVTSDDEEDTLTVLTLPSSVSSTTGGAASGPALVCTLGGASSPAPMQFEFNGPGSNGSSGLMAFSGPATCRLLLLADVGHDAVHVIDVVGRVHVGYVAAPGTIAGPRGVAARGSLVAVSAWKKGGSGEHAVRMFEGSGAMWTAVRAVGGSFGGPGSADGQLSCPRGLRFTGDGTELAVADYDNNRVSMFRVEDGSFARHVATDLTCAFDVEECEEGWLVACWGSGTIEFVGGGGGGRGGGGGGGGGGGDGVGRTRLCLLRLPSALALVPDLGLVVLDYHGGNGRVQFFATPDAIAMSSMSPHRVAWMVAVARGTSFRGRGLSSGAALHKHRRPAGAAP